MRLTFSAPVLFEFERAQQRARSLLVQEKPRPTYTALSPGVQVNPVTRQLEPHYPESISTWSTVFGIGFIVLLVRYSLPIGARL